VVKHVENLETAVKTIQIMFYPFNSH
jgi:hypothetical protein